AQVDLERCRVHRHEHVGRVAGGEHVVRGEVDLEARDAERGARGGADLGGEVGEGREIVAGDGGGLGELIAGQLHAVAGVAREADDDRVEDLATVGGFGNRGVHGETCGSLKKIDPASCQGNVTATSAQWTGVWRPVETLS